MEKNNTGYKVIVTILIIAVVGLVSYIVYDKMSTDKIVDNDNNTQEKNDNNNIDNATSEKDCSNVYSDFVNNLKKNRKASSYYEIFNEFYDMGIEYAELDKDRNAKLHFSNNDLINKYGQDYIFAKNIIELYHLEYGNGGMSVIIGIKEDGSLVAIDSLELVNNKNIVLKENINDVKNIVNIYQRYAFDDVNKFFIATYISATDIYGNTYFIDIN